MKLISFTLFILITSLNCSSTSSLTRNTPPLNERQLIWRDGADSFAAFEGGKFYLYNSSNKSYIKLYKRKKLTKSIFKLMDAANFLEIKSSIDTSGLATKIGKERDYKYIKYKFEASEHEVYWRSEGSPILDSILNKLHELY